MHDVSLDVWKKVCLQQRHIYIKEKAWLKVTRREWEWGSREEGWRSKAEGYPGRGP